ncbi:hypothetical protein [Leptolyngbya sp. NIES-2104]|uniref:hypothetical protein n=1 Tax=Leptolyngbya sp. NIES-2104 TaxID=1552121 RepID=UPI0006EC874A|nr:hypothetical protein [Leptolyngbya sp. NIES-2104]GAP95497.1 hypothetical protein NIES2104_20190 [Leptolyngbya sp. NIES-2104]
MISTLAPEDTQNWLHSAVQSFFANCNWEDKPVAAIAASEVQRLEQAAATESFTELSFDLRVRQFFAAVNWDGTAMTPMPVVEEAPTPEPDDGFTLTDFSDLF